MARPEPPARAQGPDADPAEVARTIGLRLLDRKDRTRAEFISALVRRGVDAEIAESLATRFEQVGLIDDRRYARAYAESRQQSRRISATAVRRELRQRGVGAEAMDEVDEALSDDHEVALDYARRRAQQLSGFDRPVRYRRLAGALGRRGFSPHVIHDVLAQVMGEVDDPPADEPEGDLPIE